MRLVNPNNGFVVLEFQGDQTIIHDKFLNAEMIKHGISIPAYLLKAYNNQEQVRLGDTLFQRAFKEIYYPFAMSRYIWKP